MNRYQRAIKYTKPLTEIDEKIAYLNEKMTTSGLYSIVDIEAGLEEVPPTFTPAPLGDFEDLDTFVWADQGDGSDSSYYNVDQLKVTDTLGRTMPRFNNIPGVTYDGWDRKPNYSLYPDGVVPLAFAFHGRAISSTVLGYIDENGFNAVVQSGVFTTPGSLTPLQSAYLDAWNSGNLGTSATVYLWGGIDCLFGSCYGGAQYYPSDLSNTSTPKASRVLYAYTIKVSATGNSLFASDPGVRSRGPRVNSVLSRDDLGDPGFFPGVIDFFGNLLGMGKSALDAARNYATQLALDLSDYLGVPGSILSTYVTAAPPFLAHLAHQQGLVNYTEDKPLNIQFSSKESQNVSQTLNSVMQTIPPERWENLSDTDLRRINSAMNKKNFGQYSYTFYNLGNPQAFKGRVKTDPTTGMRYVSGMQDNYIFTSDLDAAGVPGAKDLLNLSMTANNAQQRPDMQSSSYTYTPGVPDIDTPELKQKNTPVATNLPPPQLTQSSFNKLPPDVKQNIMDTMKKNFLKQYDGSNYQGSDLQYMRDRAQQNMKEVEKNTEFRDGKMIMKQRTARGKTQTVEFPLFSEQVIYEQTSNPVIEDAKIKLRDIDYLRHYKVSEKERDELDFIVSKINLMLDENPDYYEFILKRYPKDDPRLAELNWKLDQMLNASHEYVQTRFPENKEQTSRVKKILARNIELTDPKTFKDPKPVLTYGKVFKSGTAKKYAKRNVVKKKSNNLYTKTLAHTDMNRVKEMHEEKIKEEKIAQILREQQEILAELAEIEAEESKYVNWRKELAEGMTTSSLGMINLPAAGDVDIIDTDTTYDNINSSLSQNVSRSGTTITLQGSENQIVGGTHTAYNVARFEVDGTRVSHVKITISKGGGTSSWTDRDGASNFDDSVTLNITDADDFFAPLYNDTNLTSGTHLIRLPGNYTNLRISFEQFAKVGETGALTISNVSLQRRTPINLVVSLDDPEANSFIRGGLGGSEERKKQLKDMLEAGNQWMYIQGLEPSKTSPGDIELDKVDTGKDYGEIAGSLSGPRNSPGPGVPRDSPRGPYTPLKNYGTDKNPKLMPSGPSVNPWRLA